MMVWSVCWQHGGVLAPEIEDRLPYYLSDGSLPGKLYDSDYLERGMYQARELSYFFDFIDCKFIALSIALGVPHFFSLTQYVFLVLISFTLWRFGVEDLKAQRWIVLLVLLLFWTTPAVFLGGTFFRTAKIGTALTIVVLYRQIYRILSAALENPAFHLSWRWWLVCFGWAWASTLFDRQGVFLVGVFAIFLGVWYFCHRDKTVLKLTGAFLAALVLSLSYNYIIAPLLTLSINHYWPDFKYQHLPWQALAQKPPFYVGAGISLYFDVIRFFLGNIPSWGAVLVFVALACLAWATGLWRVESKLHFLIALGSFLCLTILIWVMLVLMVLRHESLIRPELRRLYYLLPVVSLFAMTLLLALSRLKGHSKLPQWCLALLLGGALVGNIVALPRHDAVLRSSIGGACYQSSPPLLVALRNLRNPRYVVSPEISSNRVYQFFHDGRFSKYPVVLPPGNHMNVRRKPETN